MAHWFFPTTFSNDATCYCISCSLPLLPVTLSSYLLFSLMLLSGNVPLPLMPLSQHLTLTMIS